MSWFFLAGAIAFEIVATSFLKASEGFTRPLATVIVLACYAVAFYCLSVALRAIPMGIAYALWSGIGIVMISLIGWLFYRETLDAPALIGIGLILAGTLTINLWSQAAQH